MEDPGSQPTSRNAADEKAGGVSAHIDANNAESPASSSTSETPKKKSNETSSESLSERPSETSGENTVTRPTAIERQAAAASRLSYGNPTYQEAVSRAAGWRETYADRRRPPKRSGLVSFLVVLLVAAGVALVFTSDFGRPARKAVSAALVAAQQTVARYNPSSALPSPVTPLPDTSLPDTSLPDTSLPVIPSSNMPSPSAPLPAASSPVTNSSPASEPPPAVTPKPADVPQTTYVPQTTAPQEIPAVATSGGITVPIADVSLQTRPELLEQLAHVYKSKLVADPNDLAALAALNRLQERSLSELETIISAGDHSTAGRSLAVISRVFPEVVDTARYKYLAARTNHIPGGAATTSTTTPATSTPPTTVASPSATPVKTVSPAPEKNASPAPEKSVSTASVSSTEIAKEPTKNVLSTKPKIHVVSITPGAMIENQFSPRYDGNVFRVEISYRNFASAEYESETTLVARLGVPGDPMVLAEVPVNLLGGRGTKSFVMEALRPGNIGERYQLNFLLNDEFFASSTVRLSMPAQ